MSQLLKEVKDMGFTGVQNFPTVGLIDGVFRLNLEETGMSYEKEVEMIKLIRSADDAIRFQRQRGGTYDQGGS